MFKLMANKIIQILHKKNPYLDLCDGRRHQGDAKFKNCYKQSDLIINKHNLVHHDQSHPG